MGHKIYTENYLMNQVNWIRKWSLSLAAVYLIISIFLDYFRFPKEALNEIYFSRVVFMVIPLAVVLISFFTQDKFGISRWVMGALIFIAVIMFGFGHSEIINISYKYQSYFAKMGLTIILIYSGLLLILPIKFSIFASLIIILFATYAYYINVVELSHAIEDFIYYSLFATCCVLSNYVYISILKSNLTLMEKTTNQAITDELTGLFNRRHFYTGSNKIFNKAIKDGNSAALILIDLDNFKSINDEFGHVYGDRVLAEFSKILKNNCKHPNDQASRLGGDEFALLLYDLSTEIIHQVCENILIGANRISDAIKEQNDSINFGATLGIAENKVGETNKLEYLFELADKSLYQVKQNGKNNYLIFDKNIHLEYSLNL